MGKAIPAGNTLTGYYYNVSGADGMENKKKISLIGPLNTDVMVVGNAPDDWRLNQNWESPAEISIIAAGSVGYTAQDFAKLGNYTKISSNLSDDCMGVILLDILTKSGVDTNGIRVLKGKKTAAAVYWLMYGNRKRPMAFMPADFLPWPNDFTPQEEEYLLDCDLLHCGGYLHYSSMYKGATTGLYKKAKQKGIITSIDTQFPTKSIKTPWLLEIEDIIRFTDVLIADEHEGMGLTGADTVEGAIERLLETGIKILVLKMGASGSWVCTNEKRIYQPVVDIGPLVDSIGAGDAYGSAFLTALLDGWDLEKCALFASTVAGFTVTRAGGVTGMPDRRKAENYMKEHYKII